MSRAPFIRAALLAAMVAAEVPLVPAHAASCGDSADGFESFVAAFKREATRQGVSPATVESALADVSYDDSVISHDRGQRSFSQSFERFASRHITPYALKKGKTLLLRYAEPLQRIEQRYGVPGAVLVAIWGLETGFGSDTGHYPTFSALATLAYDCRRAEHFREELLDALKIVERGDLAASEMRGAWAGEIGQTQFMPSSYLKYGVGDMVRNPMDALASTANFLHGNGWQRGAGWDEGQPNFAALLEWNQATVYTKTIALFADKLAGAYDNDSQ